MNHGRQRSRRPSKYWATILLGAAAMLLVTALVSAPETAFKASLQAVKLWWNIVFPALLPFLVLVEIMTAYGWAHGLGTFLDPVMKKIFRLPGTAGWTLITGLTAGFPAGAQSAAGTAVRASLNPKEEGRLTALAHFCNPMTILIVISTGLLQQPAAGYFLLAVHWASGMIAGWLCSLGSEAPKSPGQKPIRMLSTENQYRKKPASLLRQAARAASEARDADGRSFGRLLGDSVSRSVQTLMMTGGHIIIFAVLISVLAEYLFHAAPVYLLPGMLEIHLGAQAVSSAVFGSSALQMAVLSAVLAWSGISAHFQTLAAVKAKGISWLKFAMQRLLQAVVAFLLALLLWKPSGLSQNTALPAFGPIPQAAMEQRDMFSLWSGLHIVLQWQLAMALSIAIVLYAVSRIISRVYP